MRDREHGMDTTRTVSIRRASCLSAESIRLWPRRVGVSDRCPRDADEMTDWVRWHDAYDHPGSPFARRLAVVRLQIGLALDRAAPGRIALLSLCAGQGRDVLPVLAEHPRGGDVGGRLVELDPQLCATARAAAPPGVDVVQDDAGTTAACAGAAPADLLLLCGVFGNVPDGDIARTITAVPSLLTAGGTVVWTRHTGAPDITPRIRTWFAEAGVAETAFVTGRPYAQKWAVGAGTVQVPSSSLGPDERLFTFFR
ncbi:MAG: hypothetical protein QOI16_2293 [Pseudonocardiales bacterium]|nr:hypothetical protein [Pseudonocardiales bacterium]